MLNMDPVLVALIALFGMFALSMVLVLALYLGRDIALRLSPEHAEIRTRSPQGPEEPPE